MKPSSCKNKGRNGQKEVVNIIMKHFPALQKDDVGWRSMGAPGEDILLSPLARSYFPFSIEVKRLKAIAAIKHLDQAEANAGEHTALVFMKADRGKWVVLMDAETFVEQYSLRGCKQ